MAKETKYSREVIPRGDLAKVGAENKISINKNPVSPITYGDILGIPSEPVRVNQVTTFKMDCSIEEIPVRQVNRILGMSATPKDLIIRGDIATYFNANKEEIEWPINYITKMGDILNLTITGDLGASYELVVKDINNTKWYNWETNVFVNGYYSKQGTVDYKAISLKIPPKTDETKYQIFFKPIGSISYSSELPTESNPWQICQLKNATTTFKFDDRNPNFISDTVLSKTYPPGAVINTDENGTTIDCTLTILPKRGKIELVNPDSNRTIVNTKAFNSSFSGLDQTTIFKTDLVATVDSDYSTGTISGTITLHKSAVRDFDFSINPTSFFKII